MSLERGRIMKRADIEKLFDIIDADKHEFILDTLDEYLFFKKKIAELKKYPLIRVSKSNPALQQITAAGKLIKDYSNVVDAKRATMLRELHKVSNSAADELAEMLAEFE